MVSSVPDHPGRERGPVISSVAAEHADTCFELRFVDAEGAELSAAPQAPQP
jgi:hypothetical protein